jgi:spore cortex protein
MKSPPPSKASNERMLTCFLKGVFRLDKKSLLLPAACLLSLGLAGCGNNDEAAVQERNVEKTQPIGYYSNENHDNGEENFFSDNDGPIPELLDHNFGTESQNRQERRSQILEIRDENDNPENLTTPPMPTPLEQDMLRRDNQFSTNDANYHGHLNDNNNRARSSYYTAYDGRLAEKIGNAAGSVHNVKDVRSVVYGDDVLIAVDLNDYLEEEKTKSQIKKTVRPYLNGRSATIVTDEGTFSRVRTIDNEIRDGGPRDGVNMDLRNMFRTIRNNNRNNR